jgi:hypothetical protein
MFPVPPRRRFRHIFAASGPLAGHRNLPARPAVRDALAGAWQFPASPAAWAGGGRLDLSNEALPRGGPLLGLHHGSGQFLGQPLTLVD